MKIQDLQPGTSIDSIEIEVVDMDEPREFSNFRGSGRVTNALAKDDTGETKLTLWNDQIDQVTVGDVVIIENGWVREYRGEIQISTGKFGKLTVKGAD